MTGYRGSVTYGRQNIAYTVVHAERKTLEIAVHPDGKVMVKAPKGTARTVVKKRVMKRARWIGKQIRYFHQFEPRTPPRRYVGGETHLFLGRQYRLKIIKQRETGVKLKGGRFCVMTLEPESKLKTKNLLAAWYQERARLLFSKRLQHCCESAKRLPVPYPTIRLKIMSKRWGSCSKTGDILLNTNLIKAPVYCIDYVIMHELCHLKEHTHNRN